VSGTVNISVSDSSAPRAVEEIFYEWAKSQLPKGSIVTLPGRGNTPGGGTLLIGVPVDILPILRERGVQFVEVPKARP
jgi:hypothetical protein